MQSFDENRFLHIQNGALAQGAGLDALITELVADPHCNLFFLGAGGAAILMLPAARLLQRSSSVETHVEISAELVVAGHARLGRHSLAVIPSLSGTTAESLAALEYCRSRGARTLVLTGNADSPLARAADWSFVNFAEDDTSCESFYIQSLLLALFAMAARGERDDVGRITTELTHLPHLLLEVKRTFDPRAEALAEKIRNEPWHIIAGAGNLWPQAWYYGMCILEEMQWIRTRPIHAADFFHGTLELVEPGVSAMVFKGEDACRGIAERAERFLAPHTEKLFVLDTADFALEGLTPETRALVSPMIVATALERLSAHLEVKRDHKLTIRRYYRRKDY